MSLNMSLADAIVNFAITIIGAAIMMLLANKISNVQRKIADWWAQRSASAAIKRIRKIEIEIAKLNVLHNNFQKQYAAIEKVKNRTSVMSALGFTNLIMQLGLGIMLYNTTLINKDYLSTKAVIFMESDIINYIRLMVSIGLILSITLIFSASYKQVRLRRLINLEETIKELSASVERLKKRII